MMNHTVIGHDVHARSITAAAVDVASGEIETRRFGYDPAGLAEWMAGFPRPIKTVYESGVTGNHLYRALNDLGFDCVIGAVSKMLKPASDRRKKTDRYDAEFLARMLASNNIVEVYVPDEECEGLRDLSRAREDARSALLASVLQLSGFLVRHGFVWNERTPTGRLKRAWGGSSYNEWLTTIKLANLADQDSYDYYYRTAFSNMNRVKELDGLIFQYARTSKYKTVIDALCCLKGIDVLTAFALAVEVDDFYRFKKAGSFASWLGLSVSEHSSGEKQFRGSITKAGNSRLRRMLMESSWSFIKSNVGKKQLKPGQEVSEKVEEHAYKGNLRLKRRRRHLLEQGKQSCVANTATARELACWIWAIGRMAQEEAR